MTNLLENRKDTRVSLINIFLDSTGIQRFLDDDDVTEIIINRPNEIITEGSKGWQFYESKGVNNKDLLDLLVAINNYNDGASALNAKNPIKSLVMPNGERLQVIIPPACELDCISLTIRKPSLKRFTIQDYIKSGRFANVKIAGRATNELSEIQKKLKALYLNYTTDGSHFETFLQACVDARLNILIVGGTGSGKTTFGKTIADMFPSDRRIITIEDVHEMELPLHKNHVHLFYKEGGVKARQLIESAMRMKPDHIFLAELRGDEAWSYIEALNTGHEGSVTTIHANNTYASFSRLVNIIKQSPVGLTLEESFIAKTVKTTIDVILFFNHTYCTECFYEPEEKNKLLTLL
ncbi:P-type DNA transfer ATPase VirB11 [Arsenophonus sp.]|uniref:P-type DNA transfer ATPase VirB11 n=1 Tax=Arsenophonus sp. TaxID=1872640 RepID=UPI002856C275|nr:P-type DNA transfer ATPase VirB11 [Arsenophonus sp.]MDR5615022.1 P-type DNA transfer ATPase VirB11 [Arsenophonus sp.]